MRKILLFSFALLLSCILVSCKKEREKPSRKILASVLKKYPNAERIQPETLRTIRLFASVAFDSGTKKIFDIQDVSLKKLSNTPEYKSYMSVYSGEIVNDSTLFITEFNPVDEKNVHRVVPHNRKYYFFKNGDIEIEIGNAMVKRFDPSYKGVLINLYIDGETGLITYYYRDEFGATDWYVVTESGKIKIGNDFRVRNSNGNTNSIFETFHLLEGDLASLASKH